VKIVAEDLGSLVVSVGMDSRLFQEGVTTINRQMTLLKSQFQTTASSSKVFGDSAAQIKNRMDYLNQAIELQRAKIQKLAEAYEITKRETGEYSSQTTQAGISLNKAITQLNNLENELKQSSKQLDLTTSKWKKLSDAGIDASEKMKKVGEKLSEVGKGLTAAVTAPIIGIGTAATKMAMEAVESENLFEVSFGKMAKAAREWSDITSKALGLNAFAVRRNAATYYTMLSSMGLAEEKAYEMSTSMTKLAYDMASFYNLNPEEAFEKLRAGITGEAEPLKTLGVLISDATVQAYAMNNGIGTLTKTKEGFKLELTETDKVLARYGLIMKSTSQAQGDLARTMDSPTNQLRIMKEQITQIGIEFGQILIPVLQNLLQVIQPVVDGFRSLNSEQQQMAVKYAAIVAAVGPVIYAISKLVMIIGAVVNAFSAASGAIAAAGGVLAVITGPIGIIIGALALVGVAVYAFMKNWEDMKAAYIKVGQAIAEFTTSTWNSITTFLSSTWTTITKTVSNAWESIKNFIFDTYTSINEKTSWYFEAMGKIISGAWEVIKNVTLGSLLILIDLFTGNWSKIKDDLMNLWENISDGYKSIWNGIEQMTRTVTDKIKSTLASTWKDVNTTAKENWTNFGTLIKDTWEAIIQTANTNWREFSNLLSKVWQGLIATAKENISQFIDLFKNLPGEAYRWGANMIQGFINGMKSMISSVADAATSVANRIRDYLGFNSPAKEGPGQYIVDWGRNMIAGFMDGIQQEAPKLKDLLSGTLQLQSSNSKSNGYATASQSITVEVPIMLDGKLIAKVVTPVIDVMQGRNVKLAGRGMGI
jgi:phage-related protein